ncbi:tRNA-specific 2-thiouridylase mnmA 2 [Peptoclostridium acidaminophilum DSM 3953]|uniref:tRNA-specific 2-thiouridylase MnmA n=1 Tax=Peptoclostridium acidaminophilum DSM 3953 TaxID=1286171 RepID=W8TIY1_PEPAC|nr:tRNA 2-thiouridine(34) synthase MnmA [Peptoclostridium acidaminophilum]AHM56132.1 tRNA-specific 2-thiouridylase mnmA 2 [Peptoclostridium acidaminophilum DSM 3953]
MVNATKTVAVGMSGGVDSSAAAYILKNRGYNVIGITMLLGKESESERSAEDAKRIAEMLSMPHHVVDFSRIFEEKIKGEFISEYLGGRTPNPCVTCNRIIKYGKFMDVARSLGADFVATGHYARVVYDSENSIYRILRGKADRKDQSYVLYSLSQKQLSSMILPLGEYESKEDIRKIANMFDLDVSEKKDSTGICFIPDGNHKKYITEIIGSAVGSGAIRDSEGKLLGRHSGIFNYTIGQKRGLEVKLQKSLTVISIDAQKNEIILGDDALAYSKGLIASNWSFTSGRASFKELHVHAKICQWGYFIESKVTKTDDDKLCVMFEKNERAVTPGQSVVFYNGDEVIGGGIIERDIR